MKRANRELLYITWYTPISFDVGMRLLPILEQWDKMVITKHIG